MDSFNFMLHVLDPVDLSRYLLRSPAMITDAHSMMKNLVEGKFKLNAKLEKDSYEYETQKYFVRMVRRIISDLEHKYCPRIRAITSIGDPDNAIVRRIIYGLELDSSGSILMHLMYEEFFQQYLDHAKKINAKEPQQLAHNIFIEGLAGSFIQAALFLRTACKNAGIETLNW